MFYSEKPTAQSKLTMKNIENLISVFHLQSNPVLAKQKACYSEDFGDPQITLHATYAYQFNKNLL